MPGPTSEEQGVMRATSALSITLHAQSLQSGLTLCNLMDCSPPGSSVRRILQQEHRSGLPSLPPKDLPDPGVEPVSPVSTISQAGSLPPEPPRKSFYCSRAVSSVLVAHRLPGEFLKPWFLGFCQLQTYSQALVGCKAFQSSPGESHMQPAG